MDAVFHCLESLMRLYKVKRTGVIHVGGGQCEEMPVYERLFDKATYFDPLFEKDEDIRVGQPESPIHLKKYRYAIAVAAHREKRGFYKTKFRPGSSLYQPLEHQVEAVIPVEVRPLSDFEQDESVLVIDAQGAEYYVLLSSFLKYDMIIVEVNVKERYRTYTDSSMVHSLLNRNHYKCVAIFPHGDFGMQDEVYIKGQK